MGKIDELLEEWQQTEDKHRELTDKRHELENEILKIMDDNIWRDYSTDSKIHASVIDKESFDIDMNQLSILLPKKDISAVTKYKTERHLVIITPEGKKRLRKLIKVI